MQFFSLLYVLSNITTANQVFTYPCLLYTSDAADD